MRKEPFHIDAALYADRDFTIVDAALDAGMVVTKADTADRCVCIPIFTPGKGSIINVAANLNPDEPWAPYSHGMPCLVSITEAKADFSHNATVGPVSGALGAIVGAAPRPGLYVELEASKSYFVNVAARDRDAKNGMRINVSVMEKKS